MDHDIIIERRGVKRVQKGEYLRWRSSTFRWTYPKFLALAGSADTKVRTNVETRAIDGKNIVVAVGVEIGDRWCICSSCYKRWRGRRCSKWLSYKLKLCQEMTSGCITSVAMFRGESPFHNPQYKQKSMHNSSQHSICSNTPLIPHFTELWLDLLVCSNFRNMSIDLN